MNKLTKKGFQPLNKAQMNFAYGMGAAIVIIGALMKITHTDLDLVIFELTGNTMLSIGLITEALFLQFQLLISLQKNMIGIKFMNFGGEPKTQTS